MIFDLNRISSKVIFITNIITIILLITATAFFIYEIYMMKEYGGNCVRNPIAWAENYAYEEKGIMVDCGCEKIGNINISEINITEVYNGSRKSSRNWTD